MSDSDRLARAFDGLADQYDDAYHDEVAQALVEFVAPTGGESVADVACGTGAVALAVARTRPAQPTPVLAVDISAGMVAAGRARADRLGLSGAIGWRVGSAVPLPAPDGSLDVVLCASSLHFLGTRALVDWRRVLRPGGRCGFTLPVASQFRPGGVFAELVGDLRMPETAGEACALAEAAGFVDAVARERSAGSRRVFLVRATSSRSASR
ncbi:class I SAM-dependent methyltransferase [Rugosimonospora africana]|uniref:Methyltransferase n=1 Tax=Rugosimonospora africana TaxID=556532 RepID=A0A8J3QW98_9ACTN|nr:methyltransferase domain-containing protein [Rugosimonospora africana]GIH17252.1 methyltransferase [Rugosimonospora africana]